MKDWKLTFRTTGREMPTYLGVAEAWGVPVDTMEIGDTFVDADGDTWERIG